ncbi:MAG TPA: hypothetical protein VKP65_20545 [Rhodothermales bacterium]|nr:hypothetical protein [Rhodothermales bacterium]
MADAPGVHCNARMGARLVRTYRQLDESGWQLRKMAIHRLGLSARAYDRILKVPFQQSTYAVCLASLPTD